MQALQPFERRDLRRVEHDLATLQLRFEALKERAASHGEVRVGVVHRVALDCRARLRAEILWGQA